MQHPASSIKSHPKDSAPPFLSIVVPVYNEQDVLPEFHRRLSAVLDAMTVSAEIIYVNDGSRDNSIHVIQALKDDDSRVAVIDLSRNFGKEIALSAGLDHAEGDAVVVIDADLQDPPEFIPELFKRWLEGGVEVVYAKRVAREGESFMKKATAHAFYRVMRMASTVQLPEDTGDFRLLSRRAVHALRRLREHHRFMKGLFAWIGFRQEAIPYRRAPRYAGSTKWNYWKLWNFALEGITSFTIFPLKVSTYLGLFTSLGAFIYALVIIAKTVIHGDPVRGYPSLMVVILFLGGIQLLGIGVIGEYMGRMFNESKQRPLYLLNQYSSSEISRLRSGIHSNNGEEQDG